MLTREQIAAFAIETLTAANGNNLHDEFDSQGDADAALNYLCDNADELLEIAFMKGHGYRIEVLWLANSHDIAAFCATVAYTGEYICDSQSNGEAVATFAFAKEGDAIAAACAVMTGLVVKTNAAGL